MFVGNIHNLEGKKVTAPESKNAFKKHLIGPQEGWEGWVMRFFTLKEGGNTPRHAHPWPHINYIVAGSGVLFLEGREYPLTEGSVAYVPAGLEHQFISRGKEDFSFICIVPEEGDA